MRNSSVLELFQWKKYELDWIHMYFIQAILIWSEIHMINKLMKYMWNPKFQIRRNCLNYSSWYIMFIIKMHIYVGFGLCLIFKNSIMRSQMKLYYLSMQNIWSAITWNTMIDLHGVALVKTIYNRHAWKDILWLFGTNAQNSIFHAFSYPVVNRDPEMAAP